MPCCRKASGAACRPPLEPPAPAAGTFPGADPAPMLSAAAQAALEGDLAGPLASDLATTWQPPWRGPGRRSWHETPDFRGVQQMRRNILQTWCRGYHGRRSWTERAALQGRDLVAGQPSSPIPMVRPVRARQRRPLCRWRSTSRPL